MSKTQLTLFDDAYADEHPSTSFDSVCERAACRIPRIRPPVKAHGGKFYLARRIVPVLLSAPGDPTEYLEPCAFGASVFLNLPRFKREILGDLNPDVVRLWQTLGDSSAGRRSRGTTCENQLRQVDVRLGTDGMSTVRCGPDSLFHHPQPVLPRRTRTVVCLVGSNSRRKTRRRECVGDVSADVTAGHHSTCCRSQSRAVSLLGDGVGKQTAPIAFDLCRSTLCP